MAALRSFVRASSILLLGYIAFPQQRFQPLHRVLRQLELGARMIDLRRRRIGAGLLRCDLTPSQADLRFQCRDLGASLAGRSSRVFSVPFRQASRGS
jgi:hypothetical protein